MESLSRRAFLRASGVGVGAAMGGALVASTACADEGAEAPAPRKVRAAVFSSSGGTAIAAARVADALSTDVEIIDQTPLSSRDEEISFSSDEIAIMAAPAYGGNIPLVPNMFTNLKSDQTPCVLVAAYGNREAENNWAQMNKIATENGFVVIGAIKIITPHIQAATVGLNRPNLNDLSVIEEFAGKVLAKLDSGELEPIVVEGNPENTEKSSSEAEQLRDDELCTHCGTCVTNCPAGAIDAETLEINHDVCIFCQHCVFVCPECARTYKLDWDKRDAEYGSPRKEITYVV